MHWREISRRKSCLSVNQEM